MSLLIPHMFFDPHELASWVNKVSKLDTTPPPCFDPHELVSWVNKVCQLDTDAPTQPPRLTCARRFKRRAQVKRGRRRTRLACKPWLPARRAGRGAIHGDLWGTIRP